MHYKSRITRIAAIFAAALLSSAAHAEDAAPPAPAAATTAPDAMQLEADMQQLDWEQFRSVVESIPKLKADVDAYGPAGWTYVKGKYKTYAWHRNIERLDDDEKRRLAALIEAARKSR
ncbi:MAG: hypothetical protein ACM3Y9_06070 [Ignavibacteria bacterium]